MDAASYAALAAVWLLAAVCGAVARARRHGHGHAPRWAHDHRWRSLARSVPHDADGAVARWPRRWGR